MPQRTIHGHILFILTEQCVRLTPSDLKRKVRETFPSASLTDIRAALKDLVFSGDIVYTNHFNTTHLEMGHRRPFQVSERILLAPSGCTSPTVQRGVVVRLNDGAAFGMGDHPTSRLMMQAIDHTLSSFAEELPPEGVMALDIGTGSGLLAIAAACLGVASVVAVDTDPLACMEAEKNARLNQVHEKVAVTDDIHAFAVDEGYAYIFANLRPPTLKRLFPLMRRLSADTSIWILSGFRERSYEFVGSELRDVTYEQVWENESCGWGAIALKLNQNGPQSLRKTPFRKAG